MGNYESSPPPEQFGPAQGIDEFQEQAMVQEQERSKPTLLEGYSYARQLEDITSVTMRNLQNAGAAPDPSFKATPELVSQWAEGLDESYVDYFADAHSEQHGWAIRSQILEEKKADEALSQFGWGGIGLRVLAAATDPVSWGAMVASEGAAAPWIFATKANRLQRAVRAGLVAGTSNASIEAYINSQSVTRDPTDILWAGALGFGLGAAFTPTSLKGLDAEQAASRLAAEIEQQEARHVMELKAEGEEFAAAEANAENRADNKEQTPQMAEFEARVRAQRGAEKEFELHETSIKEIADDISVAQADLVTRRLALEWFKEYDKKVLLNSKDSVRYKAAEIPDVDSAPDDIKEILGDYIAGTDGLRSNKEALKADIDDLQSYIQTRIDELDGLSTKTEGMRAKMEEARLAANIAEEQAMGPDSVGAARVENIGMDRDILDTDTPLEYLDNVEHDTSKLGILRFDIVGRLLRSPNEFARHIGSRLAEDAMGRSNHAVAGKTASETATWLRTVAQANVMRESDVQYRKWIESNGGNWWDVKTSFKLREQFNEEVADVIRGIKAGNEYTKAVASKMQSEYERFLKKGKEAGIKGFDVIEPNPNYFPRFFDQSKVTEFDAKYGTTAIEKLIAKAIHSAIPDIDEGMRAVKGSPYSDRLARAYWNKVRGRSYGLAMDFSRTFSADNIHLVREILVEGGVEGEVIEGIEYAIKKANERKDGGKMSRAKRRLDLDEGVKLTMKNKDTGTDDVVSMRDLFHNDATEVFNIYSRQVSGQIGLAEAGFKSEADFSRMLELTRERGRQLGMHPKKVQKEIEQLELLYNGIKGSPLERDPASWLATAGRFMRDWNFLRIMNQVGFAQLAEIGNMVGQVGWGTVLKHIPEMAATMRRLKNGEIDDELAREIEAVWGIGTERMRNIVSTRYDTYGFEESRLGGLAGKVQKGMDYGKRITADISMMAPINIMLHRTSAKAVLQRFTDEAMSGKKINPKRLASLGLDEPMMVRIRAQLKEFSKRETGTLGVKLRKTNIQDWTDKEAANALIHGVNRWAKRIIQENDIGATHEWMHSTLGKILFQFRSFMMVAWGKQTLHNIHMRDMEAFSAFAWSMMFGGLAYSTQTAINSVGRDDQKQYLKERLSPVEVAKASFQRAGAASLIPAALDTAWTSTYGDNPIFAYGRSTGLASDAFLGNPTVDLINKVSQGMAGVSKSGLRSDYDFSQKDFRNIWSLLWFSNAMGVRNISNILGSSLPKQSTYE